jgi:polysaccharide export outer membrane protein
LAPQAAYAFGNSGLTVLCFSYLERQLHSERQQRFNWSGIGVLMLRNLVSRLILILILGSFPLATWAQNAALPAKDTGSAKSSATEASAKEMAPGAASALAAGEYKIGEGDVLHINVWKEPELSKVVVVRPDGNVSLPLINEVKVSGMTAGAASRLVADRLKTYVLDAQVNVEVTEIRSRRVFITGEIARPGEYPLAGPMKVLQLIAQAGGFTPFAKRKKVFVVRMKDGEETRLPFNYPEVARGHSPAQDIPLLPGDTVVVP